MLIKTVVTRSLLVLIGACALLVLISASSLMLSGATDPSFEKYLAMAEIPAEIRTTSAWASYGGPGAAKFA